MKTLSFNPIHFCGVSPALPLKRRHFTAYLTELICYKRNKSDGMRGEWTRLSKLPYGIPFSCSRASHIVNSQSMVTKVFSTRPPSMVNMVGLIRELLMEPMKLCCRRWSQRGILSAKAAMVVSASNVAWNDVHGFFVLLVECGGAVYR
jgi:hypothetical protein